MDPNKSMSLNPTIEPDQLLDKPETSENVICPICRNIFMNPVACANCLNHFCRVCIQSWLYQNPNKTCPLCKNFKELRCFPLLQQILTKLQFKCLNSKYGCEERIRYDNYVKHHEQCQFKLVPCTSQGCTEMIIRNKLESHLSADCAFVKRSCKWCEVVLCKNQLPEHEAACDFRLAVCQKCQVQVKIKDMSSHLENCPENEKPCRWCKKNQKVKSLNEHQEQCEWRQIRCIGCDYTSYLVEFFKHQSECPEYPIFCTHCNQEMKRKALSSHTIDKCIQNIRAHYESRISDLQEKIESLSEKIVVLEDTFHSHQLKFSATGRDGDIFIANSGMTAIVSEFKRKRRDRFILIDLPAPLGESDLTWEFNIEILRSAWFAIGISEQSNVYAQRRYHEIGHMSYLISANGILYNSHSAHHNWQNKNFKMETKDIIVCKYRPRKKKLYFYNLTKNIKLVTEIDMALITASNFYPCACLRCPGDKISIKRLDNVDDSQDDIEEIKSQQNQNNIPSGLSMQSHGSAADAPNTAQTGQMQPPRHDQQQQAQSQPQGTSRSGQPSNALNAQSAGLVGQPHSSQENSHTHIPSIEFQIAMHRLNRSPSGFRLHQQQSHAQSQQQSQQQQQGARTGRQWVPPVSIDNDDSFANSLFYQMDSSDSINEPL